jgi:hypothetical protein
LRVVDVAGFALRCRSYRAWGGLLGVVAHAQRAQLVRLAARFGQPGVHINLSGYVCAIAQAVQ